MVAFGTSGLRGLAEDLTDDVVGAHVAAFVSLYPNVRELLIGRDARASTPRIADAVARAANGMGLVVVDCGVLPTPALAGFAAQGGALAIMVTGSHIPADRNGLKFYGPEGEITKAKEARLAALVRSTGPVEMGQGEGDDGGTARENYVDRFTSTFGAGALSGLRVGFWEHSSAARGVLPEVLSRLGAEVVLLGPSDSFVAVDTEAIDGDVRQRLQAWASENTLDAIVSTDGDGDRPLVADANGAVIPGDVIGPLVARFLGARDVVTTVSANTVVERLGVFESVHRTRIGSPYVIEKMSDIATNGESLVVGYEPNGGFLTGSTVSLGGGVLEPLMTRDAMLPIVAMLALAKEVPLAKKVGQLPPRRTATDRLEEVPADVSQRLVGRILAGETVLFPDDLGDICEIDTIEGARVHFSSGRIVTVRPSGNAPELRCYVEAESDALASSTLQEVLRRIRSEIA